MLGRPQVQIHLDPVRENTRPGTINGPPGNTAGVVERF